MGLDGVELVMEFEDEFGLSIPDAAAEKMFTVGDTVKHVVAALQQQSASTACPKAVSFYRLRRELVKRFEISRGEVQLDAAVDQLVPPMHRRDWRSIADASDLRRERHGFFKSPFPAENVSVRQLIETRCKDQYRRANGAVDANKVFERVRQIVAEQMGVPISQVELHTNYVKDLGVG